MAVRFIDGVVLNKKEEPEELLVFGYSCKLFRDDEKALFIDQGKHLIPWMGDDTLKIDRYDARGTLYDLRHVEPPVGGYDRLFGLTDTERHVEMLCEQERYRALTENEEEECMYREEELKRLQSAINDKGSTYGQVEYKYDRDSAADRETDKDTVEDTSKTPDPEDDEPFVPSPQLDIPLNMVLPETMKHNAIIEKTAMFITSQGPQMEILLKMKQAGNAQFNFLSFDNPLHAYYRLLLMAMKAGRYNPVITETTQETLDKDTDKDDADEYYLHPSLASSVSKVESAPSIPSITYKPSADCAYTMLVSRIKDKKDAVLAATAARLVTPSVSRLKQALNRIKDEPSGDTSPHGEANAHVDSNHTGQTPEEGEEGEGGKEEEIPATETQVIIDKMASYVAKNGRDFENIVRSKKDSRFEFLEEGHRYHGYYEAKVRQYEALEGKLPSRGQADDSKDKLKALAPVSFSIKKPRDAESVIEKSALPVEESSDDEVGEKHKEKESEGGTKAESGTPVTEATEAEQKDTAEADEKEAVELKVEMVDLAALEDKEERTKKILATERLKDKLTAMARGKVALATKEKQLQMERKRRAAVFLKALKAQGGDTGIPVYGPSFPGSGAVERTDNGDSDVESLPDGDQVDEPAKVSRDSLRGRQKKDPRHAHRRSRSRSRRSRKRSPHFEDNEGRPEANERLYGGATASSDSDTSDASGESPKKKRRDDTRTRKKEERRHKKKKRKKDSPRKRSKSRKHKSSASKEDGSSSKRHKRRSRAEDES